jgi:nitronate monooxygenase
VVQGPEAGGHRGTFRVADEPSSLPLTELVPAVVSLGSVPVVAAGGIMTASRASELLSKGAVAVQVGTALLDTDEAGTAATHRAALHDPLIDGTLVTRAFTGRPARSLVNRFAREHPDAPAAYPHIHHLTAPLRAAAMRVGDASTAHLWAGTGYRKLQPGPARDVVLTIGVAA